MTGDCHVSFCERLQGKFLRSTQHNLHWQLDVAFNQDKWLSKVGNAAKNRAIMNKIALNMLMHEKTAKVGVKNKRLKAAWDINYLAKVINAAV